MMERSPIYFDANLALWIDSATGAPWFKPPAADEYVLDNGTIRLAIPLDQIPDADEIGDELVRQLGFTLADHVNAARRAALAAVQSVAPYGTPSNPDAEAAAILAAPGRRFTDAELVEYLQGDFKLKRDWTRAYQGSQLVETERTGKHFTHVAGQGAPELKGDFVQYLDSGGEWRVPFRTVRDLWQALRSEHNTDRVSKLANHLYDTIYWIVFYQPKARAEGKGAEWFAETKGVSRQTVYEWRSKALAYLSNEIHSQVWGDQVDGEMTEDEVPAPLMSKAD